MQNSIITLVLRRTGTVIGIICISALVDADTLMAKDVKGCVECKEKNVTNVDVDNQSASPGGGHKKKQDVEMVDVAVGYDYDEKSSSKKVPIHSDGSRSNQRKYITSHPEDADNANVKNDDYEIVEEAEQESASFVSGGVHKEPKKTKYIIMQEKDKDKKENKISVQDDRLSESGINQENALISEKNSRNIDDRIAKNESDISELNNKSNRLEQKVESQDKVVEKILNDTADNNEKHEEYDQRLTGYDNYIEINKKNMIKMIKNNAERDRVITQRGKDIDRISGDISDYSESNKKILKDFADQDKRNRKNEEALYSISKINSVQDKIISDHGNSIERMNSEIVDQFERTKTQSDAIDKHDDRIAKNESNITNLSKDSSIFREAISRHDDAFDAIETDLNRHGEAIDLHERRLGDSEQRIEKNENSIGGLLRDGAARDKTILDHDQSIGRLDEAIIDAKIRSDRQDKSLNDHGRRIAGNEEAIRDVQEGAVYYDRDADGSKSGVLSLQGVGKAPVRLSNVDAGKDGKDAANVAQLSDAVKYLGSGATIKLDGSVSSPAYTIAGKAYDNVGDALKASDRLSVRYVSDESGKATNTIVLSGDGAGMPVHVTNVAPATRNTDAPNYAQLRQARQDAFNYTDQRFGELEANTNRRFSKLSGDIAKNRQEARSGIASALAAAGLRFDERPGKGSIATSLGTFKGATAVAAGLGYTSESGNWRVNAALAHSFATNDTSWNVGASWTFD